MVTTQALANIFDHFDRNLLTPYAVGFDRVFDRLHDHYALHGGNSSGFPPYNIRKEGDYNFVIELALETSLRRSEIANIKPEHFKGRTLRIVKAKIKPRTIPLTKRAQELLKFNLPIKKSANAILMCWKRLTKFYEIEDAHFHDLRHLSLQRFFTIKKLSVPEFQVISGHLEPRTLLKVYANLKAEDLVHKLN